ncbi:MAG: PEP-CTERM sorting domain-containing protein [Deltaproteobacteria bacterium]|jgi:hypothetical protein|nr:PEP-CTERM sorting domain-containing protein [Deltaproteobacteria bacterium]
MYRLLWMGACALALLIGSASELRAASYGNFSGNTVTFVGVQDVNGLYGSPIVSGDSLDFNPNTFETDCADSGACPPEPNEAADQLTLDIDADSGYFIEQIQLSEAGDTTLTSFIDAFAATTVVGDVFVDVLELDGAPANNINGNAQMVFTSDGDFRSDEDGYGTHIWEGALLVDIDQMIADAGQTGKATLVSLSIANTLTALGETGAAARIQKKDIDGLAITVIPEPGTALLMGLGLFALAGCGPRTAD